MVATSYNHQSGKNSFTFSKGQSTLAQKFKTSCLPESFRSKTFRNVSVAPTLQKLSNDLAGNVQVNTILMIFADSASSNRSALVMANTVATAALLCLLLYVRFKCRQKNDLLIKAHMYGMRGKWATPL